MSHVSGVKHTHTLRDRTCRTSTIPGSHPLALLQTLSHLGRGGTGTWGGGAGTWGGQEYRGGGAAGGIFRSPCQFRRSLCAREFRLQCIPYTHATVPPTAPPLPRPPPPDTLTLLLSQDPGSSSAPPKPSHPPRPGLTLSLSPSPPPFPQTFSLFFPALLQLYGEYREQLGNFARREAARLLTERQWRKQREENNAASGRRGLGRRHHHHHQRPMSLESFQNLTSTPHKTRSYSKCKGEQEVM